MLVKLFKSNNPLILLFLPFIGVILLFSSLIFSFSLEKTFTIIALLVIILFTAIYLNKGINKTILFNKPLYLTALCVTFFSCIDLTSVSYFPIVLANLFLSFGFLNLIKEAIDPKVNGELNFYDINPIKKFWKAPFLQLKDFISGKLPITINSINFCSFANSENFLEICSLSTSSLK